MCPGCEAVVRPGCRWLGELLLYQVYNVRGIWYYNQFKSVIRYSYLVFLDVIQVSLYARVRSREDMVLVLFLIPQVWDLLMGADWGSMWMSVREAVKGVRALRIEPAAFQSCRLEGYMYIFDACGCPQIWAREDENSPAIYPSIHLSRACIYCIIVLIVLIV